jgi:malate/lactate dehydrogenase
VALSLPCLIDDTGVARHLVVPRSDLEQEQLEASAETLEQAYAAHTAELG